MSVAVVGAGAFGTALAIALAQDGAPVKLWARDADAVADLSRHRENRKRLPGAALPPSIAVTEDAADALDAETVLLAIPMQALAGFLSHHGASLGRQSLVACCKGIDLASGRHAADVIADAAPRATAMILSGPSFAVDIAAGLPTALTLAAGSMDDARRVQAQLSTETLRLYASTDLTGVAMGGALKNVIAIACGACIGAGFGDSARAALMTRGFAEMQRLAASLGARPETLMGLSGFGDLVLTCSSELSRNYRYGLALGRGEDWDAGATVEGAATARAVTDLARARNLDLPISTVTAAMVAGDLTPTQALDALLTRPLKEE